MALSVLLFFAMMYGFGFTATRFIRQQVNLVESVVMRLGFGLSVFIVLASLFNLVGIPLDYRIFLFLSIVPWIFFTLLDIKNKKSFGIKFTLRKSHISTLIVVGVFLFSIFMYSGGSFKYPYLENEDPWGHAIGAKYVSVEKVAVDPSTYNFAYIDPYPPGYDVMMGVIHQFEPSLQFTLKFFNGLVISLGIFWFYFMARLFVGYGKAAFATFILAMVPSYFTHFIWAHTLVIALFYPAMYALYLIREDKKWLFPAAFSIGAILLTQPDQPLKLAVMIFMFIGISWWQQKKFPVYESAAGVLGVLLSLTWWAANGAEMFSYATRIGVGGSAFSPDGGSASRAYSFNDFVFPNQTLINVPPGFGPVISILLLAGLVYIGLNYKKIFSKEKPWLAVAFLWFLFTFIFTNSVTFNLPFGLNPFRFWLLLAIPVSIIAAEGAYFLAGLIRMSDIIKFALLLLIAVAVFQTSGLYKLEINTSARWYAGPLGFDGELPGYVWLLNLPPNTKVISPHDDSFIVGFDKYSCAWCPQDIEFKKGFIHRSSQEISNFMKKEGYQYILFAAVEINEEPGGGYSRYINTTLLTKEIELANSSYFTPVNLYENGAVGIFRVK